LYGICNYPGANIANANSYYFDGTFITAGYYTWFTKSTYNNRVDSVDYGKCFGASRKCMVGCSYDNNGASGAGSRSHRCDSLPARDGNVSTRGCKHNLLLSWGEDYR